MRVAILFIAVFAMSTATANTFKGYRCSQDCAGHRAGYEWAQRKGITSKAQCTGKSQSFIEGCWAWVEGR